MTKVDIFSGFLGAGKTTLIKKLIAEAYAGEKLVLIENEFGEIAIDGGFLADAGLEITEMNSGCICCSLTGDFKTALAQVLEQFAPDRILIEPSGVGKLSDVVRAVEGVDGVTVNGMITVVDAAKLKIYLKNFGEFITDQLQTAATIVLSRTGVISQAKLDTAIELVRQHNKEAALITTSWDELSGAQILDTIEHGSDLAKALEELAAMPIHEHHHHHDHDHEHDHDDHDHEHDDEHEHAHHHDHEHDHHHEHEHHHDDHDADEVFTSWGIETAAKFTEDRLYEILKALDASYTYGSVLRAKGIVQGEDGVWYHFDHVPEESEVRTGPAAVIGRICVIGADLEEDAIAELFR